MGASEKHAAAYHGADLARRRELGKLTKVELIDYILSIENNLAALSDRIDRLAEL